MQRQLSGLLNIYKPADVQSFHVISQVRKKLGIRKAGYTGTLDNFASGLLLVGVGQGTKLIKYLLEMDKEYKASIVFGKTTETLDRTGTVLIRDEQIRLERNRVEDVLASFVRTYDQMPPQYSSKKIRGRRASDLAREGKVVELRTVPITIHDIRMLDFDPSGKIVISVRCSTGTYIRSLARDIAESLGTVAYLNALERRSNGPFKVEDSIKLDDLTDEKKLISLRDALPFFPEGDLVPASFNKLKNGIPLSDSDFISPNLKTGIFKAIFNGQLVAVLQRTEDRFFRYLDNFQAGL
jgi:tRNA pseudouridine55 synthase